MDLFNPTIDLGQVPLTGVLTIATAAILFYWAMWRVRKDIKALTDRLARLDTIDTVDVKLSDAVKIIAAQTMQISQQTERMNAIEQGIREVAAETAAKAAAAVALALRTPLYRAIQRNGWRHGKTKSSIVHIEPTTVRSEPPLDRSVG